MSPYRMFARAVLVAVLFSADLVSGYATNSSDALIANVFSNYSNKSRPKAAVDISVDFQMTNIQNVDVVNGLFSVTGWWIISWSDSRMVWNSSDFDNIDVLIMYQDDLWTPALVVSNSNVDLSAIDSDTIPLRVGSDGSITWQPPGILVVGCDLDITYYPFDKQTCFIEMTSFGYSMLEVNLISNGGVLRDYYSESGEWSLKSLGVLRSEFEYSNLDYAKLSFNVTITRKSTYYGLNVIFPVIVTGVMTIFVFKVPPDSGEKLSYSLTILLTYVVLMTLISANMPTTAVYTALLEIYVGLVLALSAFAVIMTIFILNIHHTDEAKKRIPPWLRRTVGVLQVLICKCRSRLRVESSSNWDGDTVGDGVSRGVENDGLENHQATEHRPWSATVPNGDPIELEDRKHPLPYPVPSRTITPDYHESVTWVMVADVLDALMLRVYAILIAALTVGFLIAMATGNS